MASNSPKSTDPAEVALNAVEEALKLDFGGPDDAKDDKASETANAEVKPDEPAVSSPETDGVAKVAADVTDPEPTITNKPAAPEEAAETQNEVSGPRRGRRRSRPAANDDRRNIGSLVYSLQRRPSSGPFWVALLLSIIWGAVGLGIAWVSFGDEIMQITTAQEAARNAPLIGTAVAIVIPILFFWVMALMVWRAQEMRLVARSMTEVALRLAEPEDIAKESVVSVGQAIRREVAAMGDGVERALARASELEVMVHNEVASLERSYNDNELRIRGLIEELALQRESVVSNAEKVRSAITGAHAMLNDDLQVTSERLSSDVRGATERFSEAITKHSTDFTDTFGTATERLIDNFGTQGRSFMDDLSNRSSEISDAISLANNSLSETISVHKTDIAETLAMNTGELSQILSVRGDEMSGILQTRSDELSGVLASRSDELANLLTSRSDEISQTVAAHSNALTENLANQSRELSEGLSAQSRELSENLASSKDEIIDTLAYRSQEIGTALSSTSLEVADLLSARAGEINEALDIRTSEIVGGIDSRTVAIAEILDSRSNEIVSTIDLRTSAITETLTERTGEIDERLSSTAAHVVETLDQRTGSIAETLDLTTTHLVETLVERTDAINEAVVGRTEELDAKLSQTGENIVTAIIERGGEVNETFAGNRPVVGRRLRRTRPGNHRPSQCPWRRNHQCHRRTLWRGRRRLARYWRIPARRSFAARRRTHREAGRNRDPHRRDDYHSRRRSGGPHLGDWRSHPYRRQYRGRRSRREAHQDGRKSRFRPRWSSGELQGCA